MSECKHDCSSCATGCSEQGSSSLLKTPNSGSSVKKVIAVASGKGGVGKSLITGLLAAEMQRRGHRCAVLDADITGPSIPKSFGITGHAVSTDKYILPACSASGIQIMSVNLLLENETAPVLWRGPVIAGLVSQFWTDVVWDNVDYMFVDMPPGTGDVPLTVMQSLPVDGLVIVTTPQDLVGMVVSKAVNMAQTMNVPILGMVENMSYFECTECGKSHSIFGESILDAVCESCGVTVSNTARLPIAPEISRAIDQGKIEELSFEAIRKFADSLE